MPLTQQKSSWAGVPSYKHGYLSPAGVRVQYAGDWVKHHPLEGDGLRPLLYMHLWRKNKGSESRLRSLRLPDTVVYEHNFPRAWYTYDGETREINKHPGKMLDAQSIYQHFSKSAAGSDVVAQFLTTCTPEESAASGATTNGNDLLTYVEFFTAETLREFLFGQTRKPDGILQKFVLPKGETTSRKNFQLQVMWSPLMTVVYKRTNKHRLDEFQVPVHMRSATFDGDCHLSELSLVADESKSRLDRLCREVVDHIYFTDRKLITRMVVNFKIDDDNRAWLLWCTSIRVSGDSLNPRNIRVPVTLSMRMELLNDGSSTKDRIAKRRERQQMLLLMDRQLFELSRDYEFGHHCNASHVREAKRLGLSPRGGASAADISLNSSRRGPPHPLHDALRYLMSDKGATTKSEGGNVNGTISLETDTTTSRRSTAVNDNAAERVKSELTAMALDAWYNVYSSTLSDDPSHMPTRIVELSEPLVTVLQSTELDQLINILGLERERSNPTPRTFTIRLGLLGPGRRFDRPLFNAERDVREFFDDLFASRGDEITQQCLSNDRWIW